MFFPKCTSSDELNVQNEGEFSCAFTSEKDDELGNPVRVKIKYCDHNNHPNEFLNGCDHFDDCSCSLICVVTQQQDFPRIAMLR